MSTDIHIDVSGDMIPQSGPKQSGRSKSYDLSGGDTQEDLGTGMYAVKTDFEEIHIFQDVNAPKKNQTSHDSTPEDVMQGPTEETNEGFFRMAQNLSLRAWLQQCRQNIRPWATFFNTSNFNVPPGVPQLTKRIAKNISYFMSNYFIIFMILALYCLITSPLLLIAVAASLGACYLLSARNTESKITIMGHELTLAQQYAIVAGISLPLYLLAGAGSAIFWTIGATVVVVGIHGAFYNYAAIEQNVEQENFDNILEQI